MLSYRAKPFSDRSSVPDMLPSPSALLLLALSPVAAPAASLEVAPDSLRLAAFDTAWTRIRDTHYDPEWGGVDWYGVRDEFRPQVEASESPAEFHRIMDEMLARLGESHFVFIPSAAADPEVVAEGRGDPGMRVRWIDQTALVTEVRPGGGADRAGLIPGHEILAVGGRLVADLTTGLTDGGDEATAWLDAVLAARIRGTPGGRLSLEIRDEGDRIRELEVEIDEPVGEWVHFGLLPPFRLEVEDREILPLGEGGPRLGLIRFNGWFPAAAPLLAEAVDRHRSADGIILDLRGNPGGLGGMAMGIAGHFLDDRVDLGEMRTRDTTLRFVVNPQRIGPDGSRVEPFQGPLAILVDAQSASTTEIFVGGLKALGRGHLVGEATAGQVLPAHLAILPTGDRIMHAVADFIATDGSRLEGTGVPPHLPVPLSRDLLLAEGDPSLNRALEWMLERSPQTAETMP